MTTLRRTDDEFERRWRRGRQGVRQRRQVSERRKESTTSVSYVPLNWIKVQECDIPAFFIFFPFLQMMKI